MRSSVPGEPDSHPPEPPSPRLLRLCHRSGIFGAAAWWLYAIYATAFFSQIDAAGLFVYLLGLPVCYGLAFYVVRGLAWIILAIR